MNLNNNLSQPQRGFKGIWIPAELWLREDLNPTEKILIAEIDSLDDGDGCYASNEYFAEFLQTTEQSLKNILTKLKKMNIIETVRNNGRMRWLKVNPCDSRGHIYVTPDVTKKGPQTSHICDPYNIVYNKEDNKGDRGGGGQKKHKRKTSSSENQSNKTTPPSIDFAQFKFPDESKEAYKNIKNKESFTRTIKLLENQYHQCPEALRLGLIHFAACAGPYSCRAMIVITREEAERMAEKKTEQPKKKPTREEQLIKKYKEELLDRIKILESTDDPKQYIINRESDLTIHKLENSFLFKLEPVWSEYLEACDNMGVQVKC